MDANLTAAACYTYLFTLHGIKLTQFRSTADITAPAACIKSATNSVDPFRGIEKNFTPQYLTRTLIIS